MSGTPAGDISTGPLGRGDWQSVETLFGPRGACGGCWCMWWRVPVHGKAWQAVKGEPNRVALRQLIEAGRVHAVLAFADGAPVGWCCLGPRGDFPHLERSSALAVRDRPDGLWAVVCFFVPPQWRRRGVAARLLEGAVDLARERGGRVLEGYPARVGEKPLAGAFAWTGVPALFEAAGFRPLAGREGKRVIYRLRLR